MGPSGFCLLPIGPAWCCICIGQDFWGNAGVRPSLASISPGAFTDSSRGEICILGCVSAPHRTGCNVSLLRSLQGNLPYNECVIGCLKNCLSAAVLRIPGVADMHQPPLQARRSGLADILYSSLQACRSRLDWPQSELCPVDHRHPEWRADNLC